VLLNRGIYDHRRYLKAGTVSRLTGSQGPWTKPSGTDWTGRWLSPSAFGYGSANGSFLWVDPDKQVFVVFLTNAPLSADTEAKIAEAQEKVFSSAMAELTILD
jgi:CubicO group peptidase (beta-lactamase class C family)